MTPGIDGGGIIEGMADLRASDADRQRVIDLLRTHTADGRLTLTEFEERVEEALRATTIGELQHVLRELPVPPSVRTTPSTVAPRPQSRPRPPMWAVVALLVVAGSILLGHFAWWLIPLGFWTLGGCAGKGHHPARC